MPFDVTSRFALPEDHARAVLVGRVWRPDVGGPAVVVVRDGELIDISTTAATVSQLCEADAPATLARTAKGAPLGRLADVLANTPPATRNRTAPWLLAPLDLQAIKAAGVTFAISMLERVIEEKARGAPELAASLRVEIGDLIGDDLSRLKPGSPEAMALKEMLIARNMWSQYLEVGIGPDVEVFTKAPAMAGVGHLVDIGINPASTWNNPEPEIVIVAASSGRIVGAMLGNDVNLRDFEGRSALLLGKAKDNNASASLGPFLRLFGDHYGMHDVRSAEVDLTVAGEDGYRLAGGSAMSKISRDPADIMAATIGANHQYPDGVALYLGTMFAPIEDRDTKGQGFTHKTGDIVTVSSPKLGNLSNRVVSTHDAEPWTFGAGALMKNLAERKLL
jgi:fumarylacetoacetate (FAA) hydrolase family protein